MVGSYRLERGWMDHPALRDAAPYSRREAWCWLIEHAAWKPLRTSIKGRTVALKRGQLSVSVRFMAGAWGWSKSAVDRFLTRLKTDTMIGTDTGTGQLVITLCNYDVYQSTPAEAGTARGTESGTGAGQERDKEEEGKEGKEEESSLRSDSADAPPDKPARVSRAKRHEPAFDRLWQGGKPWRAEDTKAGCLRHWTAAVNSGLDPGEIEAGCRAWADQQAGDPYRVGLRRMLAERLFLRAPPDKTAVRDPPRNGTGHDPRAGRQDRAVQTLMEMYSRDDAEDETDDPRRLGPGAPTRRPA